MTITRSELAHLVDHTLLSPTATDADVAALAAGLDITADLARQMWVSALDLRIESEAE